MKNLADRRGGSVQARGPLEGWVHNQIKPCFVSLHTYWATYTAAADREEDRDSR